MPDAAHADLARLLATARREARQIDTLPAALLPATPEDGYRMNALVR